MLFAAVIAGVSLLAFNQAGQKFDTSVPVKVFLDCAGREADDEEDECHLDYLREEIGFVEYVRDRSDADVHVLVTRAETGAGGQEYTLSFIGQQQLAATTRTLTVTTEASDSEEQVRRRLATATTVGLLSYITPDDIPAGLSVTAERVLPTTAAAAGNDPWNRWIFSLNGTGSLEAEESTTPSALCRRRVTNEVLRGNTLRKGRRDTRATGTVGCLRTT